MHNKMISGFTLLELMITITVAAVLISIATPSFQTLISNNRITKVSNEYATAFRLARSNALSKGLATFICPSSTANSTNNPRCGGAATWINGFIVYSKPGNTVINAPGTYTRATDTLLLQTDFGNNTSDSITVRVTGNPAGDFLGFSNNGFTWQAAAGGAATPSFVICDEEREEERGRAFSFSVTGRLFIEDTDAADASIPDC